jgi:hypothetical protein
VRVYRTSRVAGYSRGASPLAGFETLPGSGVVRLKRSAIRSPNAGQYRAETTITVTNVTMNHSPPFKPNTHLEYGSFRSLASPVG